jgi:hypothetical protein
MVVVVVRSLNEFRFSRLSAAWGDSWSGAARISLQGGLGD